MHPQPRVQKRKHTSVVTTGSPERSGIPCAIGFNGVLRALPGDRLDCLRHRCRLDVSIGTSGPHDFAVRSPRARQSRKKHPSHPAPNVRDDRDTPLSWGRDSADSAVDLGS